MATLPPSAGRRRPRRGSVERPVSGRLYRSAWLLVALPLLVAAFAVGHPNPLPAPDLPPAFDRAAAVGLARELSQLYPNRKPGSAGAIGAARWFSAQLRPYGFRTVLDRFTARVPGEGEFGVENILAVTPGRSPQMIVVMAHRDDDGRGAGANDNASGTAALLELARLYGNPATAPARLVKPEHTIVFLSTDGGAWGALGAERFVTASPYRHRVVAVINLDSIGTRSAPRLELAGDAPRSPAAALVETAAARLADETGRAPARTSALRQLIDLGFPFSLYEQAPFVARGVPAVTLTTAGDRPPGPVGDAATTLDAVHVGEIGRAAQALLGSLDQGLELAQGTTSYVYLGSRLIRGWAIEIVLVAALLPFLLAAIDLFARCRRRRISLAPALRSYRTRLGFWLWTGAMFKVLGLAGVWPRGVARPPNPGAAAATTWPVLGLAGLAGLAALGWLVARHRLVPRRRISPEEELAGHTAALLVLGLVGLLVVATNPFALIFVLPSLHAWLWLPQARGHRPLVRGFVLLAGLAGPALLVGSLAVRFSLGFDAPWYLAELLAIGYVPLPAFGISLAWAAAAGQLVALSSGRYAPYPGAGERPPRGPVRESVRRIVLGVRGTRQSASAAPRRRRQESAQA